MIKKVSIIVPVGNVKEGFEVCLNSIVKQTLQEIEIICVDYSDSDELAFMLDKYSLTDSRILVLHEKRRSAGAARNYGMSKARGKYLLFVEVYTDLDPTMLEELYQKAEEERADIGVCGGRMYDEETEEVLTIREYLDSENLPEDSSFSYRDLPKKIYNFTSPKLENKIFRSDFVQRNNLKFQNSEKAYEVIFTFTALICADRVVIVNKEMVVCRKKADFAQQDVDEKAFPNYFEALLELKKILMEKEKFWELEQTFANYALGICSLVLNNPSSKEVYIQIYTQLKEKLLEEFRIIVHSQGYFYNKRLFSQMVELYLKEESELYLQLQRQREELIAKREHIKRKIAQTKSWNSRIDINNGVPIKVSVIIPIYNVEKYLKECIDSVLRQTLKDIQVICVNDGSTDSSGVLADEYAHKDTRIKVVHQKNGGLSAARNKGMSLANGEYILFLDSDDYLTDYALERLYCEAKIDELDDLLYCAKMFKDPIERGQGEFEYTGTYERFGDYSKTITGKEMFAKMVNNGEYKPSACLQLLKRAFIEDKKIRFKEGILHEDILFTSTCLAFAEKVRYFDQNLYMRRLRYGSIMTSKKGIRNAYGYFVSMRELMHLAKEHNWQDYKEYFSALNKYIGVLCDMGARFILGISENEIDEYLDGLNGEEIILFKLLIPHLNFIKSRVANGEKKGLTLKYRAENIRSTKKLECEIKKLQDSTPYKVGSTIMRIAQMAKSFRKQ